MITVAITSVGSGIGQSIVSACRLSRLPLRLIGFDLNPFAFGAYDCDAQESICPVSDPCYLDAVLDKCKQHAVDLLIPGLDSEMLMLAEAVERFKSNDISILVADSDFVRLSRDKLRWSQVLNSISEAVIPCFTMADIQDALAAEVVAFPLIAKPRDGSASQGVKIITAPEQLHGLVPSYIIQPLLVPAANDPNYHQFTKATAAGRLLQVAEISCQLAVSKNQVVLGKVVTYNRLKDGVPLEITPIDDETIWASLEKLWPYLMSCGMRGPVNFQGRLTASGPRFFEMNARFTGITGLRAMCGFNEVETLLHDWLDVKGMIPRLHYNPRRIGIRQVMHRCVDVEANPSLAKAVHRIPLAKGKGSKRSVLVTGGCGWLGRHLVHALTQRADVATVTVPFRSASSIPDMLRDHPSTKVELVNQDTPINMGCIDVCYHLASARPPCGGEDLANSVAATLRLFDAAARFQVPLTVFASSQSVYGQHRPPPWTESHPPAPDSPYGLSKVAGEAALEAVRSQSPSSLAVSLRLARLYGAADGMRWQELTHLFAQRAAAGKTIEISGGRQVFDLLHIHDAVHALLLLMDATAIAQPIYNVGGGLPISILEIAQMAIEAANSNGVYGARLQHSDAHDVMRFGMDISAFQRDFKWAPHVTASSAMRNLVAAALQPEETGDRL